MYSATNGKCFGVYFVDMKHKTTIYEKYVSYKLGRKSEMTRRLRKKLKQPFDSF